MRKTLCLFVIAITVLVLSVTANAMLVSYDISGNSACNLMEEACWNLGYPGAFEGKFGVYGIDDLVNLIEGQTYESFYDVIYYKDLAGTIEVSAEYYLGTLTVVEHSVSGIHHGYDIHFNDGYGTKLYNPGIWGFAWNAPDHPEFHPFLYATLGEKTLIPEPSTMLLLGSGFLGLAGYRRKFKK